jgi:hypothetical protein
MIGLLLGIFLALQNGTHDPVVDKDSLLSLAPNVCAKQEEILGFIDFYKTCENESFSISVSPGRADRIIVKVFYWNTRQPKQVLSKVIFLPVRTDSREALVTTGSIPIIPTYVKAIEITLEEKGKRIDRQKATYSRHAPGSGRSSSGIPILAQ